MKAATPATQPSLISITLTQQWDSCGSHEPLISRYRPELPHQLEVKRQPGGIYRSQGKLFEHIGPTTQAQTTLGCPLGSGYRHPLSATTLQVVTPYFFAKVVANVEGEEALGAPQG